MNGGTAAAAMESLRNLSVAMDSINSCRKEIISAIRRGAVEHVIKEIRDESTRRAHDPSVQADFSHAKGQHKLALMYLVDAVFLNAQMDRNDASLSVELRQEACRSISSFLPDLVRNLTTPSNCEQIDRLLIGWRARKTEPRFDPVHITAATACMAQAKAARQEQLRRRVAARSVPTSDGQQVPLRIGSMFGTFLPRGQPFGDPTVLKPVHPVVQTVRSRLGQAFRPRMRPPATLEFLKFNSPAAGRFDILGDDPESAPTDWADEEELAIRQELRARKPAAAAKATPVPGASAAAAAVPSSQPVHPQADTAARPAGPTIPGLPAKLMPEPPKPGAEPSPGRGSDRHSAPAASHPEPQPSEHSRELERPGPPRPEHGLPPPQSLPQPMTLLPPSGNFSATPPWVAPHGGTPSHHLPQPTPPHAMPMAHTPMMYHTLPPPAAPYEDLAVYGDSDEYMPPLPSEPYDGDGSAPPPLPDEPPPLPDEPYEAAFPDSQEDPTAYGGAGNGAAVAAEAAAASAHPAPAHSPPGYNGGHGLLGTPSHAHGSEGHAHSTPSSAAAAAAAAAAAVPPYPQPAAAQPGYMQAPAMGAYAANSTPATSPDAMPPLPGADGHAPPPMPPSHGAMPPSHPANMSSIPPPAHPPPFGMHAEWGQQTSPPAYPAHQHAQQLSTPHPASDPHYHTPPSSLYNMSPHTASQEQVNAGFPGSFPGSPERYSSAGRHDILPPAGPPPQAGMSHPQMSPAPPLQPPPGNPPPVGANPVMHYSGPPPSFPYGGPSAGGPMHGDPNAPQYPGWGPGPGFGHGQVPMGYAPPPGHPPQPMQPSSRPHQAPGGGGYLPPPPPARGKRGQMNGMSGRGKRPRPW